MLMIQKLSTPSAGSKESELVSGVAPNVLDNEFVSRMANDLYRDTPHEMGNATGELAGKKDLVGRLPSSDTDLRAESIPMAAAPPSGTRAPQLSASKAGEKKAETGKFLPGVMPDSHDQFPEIPELSKVSFQPLE